jgi:hypothetical protein
VAIIVLEETPSLSGLNGINAAALVVLSPLFVAAGFGLTAAIVALTRWISRKLAIKSRTGFAFLMLVIVGLLSPVWYLDRAWLELSVTELASLPAALLLAPVQVNKGQ